MVLNYIWIAFFVIAFVVALVRLVFWGDLEVFPAIINSTFDSSKTAFDISLGLTGILSLWLGIMKIGEQGGVINLPALQQALPGYPQRTSCHRQHLHESCRQHAGAGQRRDSTWTESHGGSAGTESTERHGKQSDDHVPCIEYLQPYACSLY